MGRGIDGLTVTEQNLFAILRTMQAEQDAAAAVRAQCAPVVCGDRRLHGGHNWQPDYAFAARRVLVCECGARARVDHEQRLYAEHGYGPPPAPPSKDAA